MPFSLIVQTDRTTCGAEQLVQNQNNVFISEKLVVVEGDETKPHPTATYPAIIKNSESDSLYTNNGLNVKAY
jgi:hypothetical protein